MCSHVFNITSGLLRECTRREQLEEAGQDKGPEIDS